MQLRDTVKMSFIGLSSHKSRSMLTILGIVIGITSIIIVMSIGQSAQQMIVGEIEGLGSTNIFVLPGREPSGADQGLSTIMTDSIVQRDIDDISKKSNAPDVVSVNPVVFAPAAVTYGSEFYNTTLLGSTAGVADFFDVGIADGLMYTQDDILQKSDVVVIGSKVADKLFGLSNPIGEKVKVKNKSMRVIGVLEPKGASTFINFDEAVLAPYSTVQQYILGIKHFQRVVVQASSPETIDSTIADIKAVLRANHNILDPAKDDFYIQTQADMVEMVGTIMTVLTILLSSIAAISLIVGGVGIMNIMFVSVTERTREIGLRKAVGATDKDILLQFLTEAIMLTFSGGIVGIVLGTLLSALAVVAINQFAGLNFPFIISYTGIVLGVTVSSVIGFAFGIVPARTASKKSPIEALRYE